MFSSVFLEIVFWTGTTIILCFIIMLILAGLKKQLNKHKDKKRKHKNIKFRIVGTTNDGENIDIIIAADVNGTVSKTIPRGCYHIMEVADTIEDE